MVEVASIVLFAGDAKRTAEFYRAIGIQLEEEDHGDGLTHLAAELEGVHFAVSQAAIDSVNRAAAWRSAGSDFPGFYVQSLDDTVAALRDIGARILTEHEQRPWGCRAVVEDPDGRGAEINQPSHCT